MSTQIKRLYQNSKEFVPITLSEAVVVNSDTIPVLNTQNIGITTLDHVLRLAYGYIGNNSQTLGQLNTKVGEINTALAGKQNKLTPGTGITIDENGVISTNVSFELYKVVTSLPTAAKEVTNAIYLVPTQGVNGNAFIEHICIYEATTQKYMWEQLGTIQTSVDLSGYVTTETFNTAIGNINNKLNSTITAQNVKTSGGDTVVVDYDIPATLYDSVVASGDNDEIITG